MQKKEEATLAKIRNIEIQGATNVAFAGIKLYSENPSDQLYKKIIATRPTEPLLQNSLKLLKKSPNPKRDSKKIIKYIQDSKKKIAKYGSKLIKNDMNIFSHCHSSHVLEILKYAKRVEKKHFVVYTLEVEPLYQGRTTAEELAKYGIKVIIFPDLALEQAISKCDLFFFGSDAYTKKGVANKIGTSLICHRAKELNIPRYSCGISLKFTNKLKIEYRSGKEVWDERQKNVDVINPAFDFTKKDLLSGVVSEFGVLSFKNFISKSGSFKPF